MIYGTSLIDVFAASNVYNNSTLNAGHIAQVTVANRH